MSEDQRPYLCNSLNRPSHKHQFNCQRHRPCSLQTYMVYTYKVPTRFGILSLYTLAKSYDHEQKMAALQDFFFNLP
jgi:hypothetical protein